MSPSGTDRLRAETGSAGGRRLAILLATLVLGAAMGTAAIAQVEAPVLPDTEYTPQAKPEGEGGVWAQVGGAPFGAEQAPETSPTPASIDFHTVRFFDQDHGFAGGARCADAGCTERVPVIWEYSVPEGGVGTWTEAYRGDEPGYVGAISFADGDPGRAIAVGGTGTYPRRELAWDATKDYTELDQSEGAGLGRVWVYEGSWQRLSADRLPDDPGGAPMRGLTAVDCTPRVTEGQICFAGGLRQLWTWKDGEFVKGYTNTSVDQEGQPTVDGASGFRFRVRGIRFMPGATTPKVQAVAITAGCCGSTENENQPRALLFNGTKWIVRLIAADKTVVQPAGTGEIQGVRDAWLGRGLPDSLYSLTPTRDTLNPRDQKLSVVVATGNPGGLAGSGTDAESLILGNINVDEGDTEEVLEPQSEPLVTGCGCIADRTQGLTTHLLDPRLSSVRLVSGDGDFAGPPRRDTLGNPLARGPSAPDGIVDWAVGEDRSTKRGVAYTTLDPVSPLSESFSCPGNVGILGVGGDTDRLDYTKCQPDDPGNAQKLASRSIVTLPSWALNAFAFVPESSIGWAVGDKGALVRFGGGEGLGGATSEPAAPRLGEKTISPLPDDSPYDGYRDLSLAGRAGVVPGLDSRPLVPLPTPQLEPAGSPDAGRVFDASPEDVRQIVMSRDGSEGWAIGSGTAEGSRPARMALYHFDGERWSSCNTHGVPGQSEPDAACAALAPLRVSDGTADAVSLLTAARIPLENDADPSNDDEFEVIAIGTHYRAPHEAAPARTVVRYRDGRWTIDREAMRGPLGAIGSPPTSVAFSAPNDGWVTADASGPALVHFDGTRWVNCNAEPVACGNADKRLPLKEGGVKSGTLRVVAAGKRVYLAATRAGVGVAGASDLLNAGGAVGATASATAPMIVSRTRGDDHWTPDHDPAGDGTGEPAELGEIRDLSIVETPAGPRGWATGVFGTKATEPTLLTAGVLANADDGANGPFDAVRRGSDITPLLRLTAGGWARWRPADGVLGTGDPESDYLYRGKPNPASPSWFKPLARADGSAIVAGIGGDPAGIGLTRPLAPMLRFEPSAETWRMLETPFLLGHAPSDPDAAAAQGGLRAVAPDGKGGFWLAVREVTTQAFDPDTGRQGGGTVSFFRYADRRPKPVFEDVAHPIRERITTATAGADGAFWVGTASNGVYRYDRLTGWDRVGIKGWDRGRLVTNPSSINAIAVGPDGRGVVVGKAGRIADLTDVGAILNLAAGTRCSDDPAREGGCGTGRDLRAAAVASDGSAMVGGDQRALLWRSATGGFQAINPPTTAPSARITGIAMPTPGRAWLTTNLGQVFLGTGGDGGWSWRREGVDAKGRSLTVDANNTPRALRAIAIDGSGRGFAVGDNGAILRRTGDDGQSWKRLDTGYADDFRSVALPQAGADQGALVAGLGGVVLTWTEGRFAVARAANLWDPLVTGKGSQAAGRIVGLGIAPGTSDGQVEAWAAMQVPAGDQTRQSPPGSILHYSSHPDEPLLNPERRAEPLPDTPAPRPGEISFAAFGRSDCHFAGTCPELHGTGLTNDVIARRVAEDIAAASKRPGGPKFAVFTGDVSHAAGRDRAAGDNPLSADTPLDNNVIHRRWIETVVGRLKAGGVPLFGALGSQDLSQVQSCVGQCLGTRQQAKAGTSLSWRAAMAGMPDPWGAGGPAPPNDGLTFRAVESSPASGPGGGARTHYAVDIVKGEKKTLARMVVVDTSLRSLEAAKANQNPVETGPQLDWVDRVLWSRPAGAQAIVVSNTPTYSYGPPAPSDTQTDATTFESILFKNRANVLVSGRLGWNSLYWATAPGLHFPCPGGSYPDQQTETPPPGSAPNCSGTGQESAANTDVATARLAEALRGLGAPPPPEAVSNMVADTNATGLLPQVVAASAGGTFGPDGQGGGSASEGYWHGYTVIRVAPPNGDARDHRPDQTIVEQRPVFDWIGISAVSHKLAPGQKLTLRGYGREPVGMDAPPRYDAIDSPAITHRYDLVEADPQRPYLPRRDADGEYVKLDPSIGSVDPVTGRVTTGKGSHPRVFAIGLLSVGGKAATWPIVFEPRASYKPPALNLIRPAIPPIPPRPPITVLSTGVSSLPSTPPPAPPPPIGNLSLNFPPPPAIPGMPPLNTAPINPPTPPVPPPPPASVAPSALDLVATPVGLNVPPQTSPIPPPSPPIQPAPPGGARKEARQKQAAVAKSEEGAGEKAEGEGGENGSAQSYTRHDADQQPLAFTAVARREQPSAWARGLTYGGGITLMAFLLSTTWLVARPKHRRREPTVPAPAWVRDTRRHG